MATLCVSHHVYLTREQRYQLAAGEDIEVVGVSVPVWIARDGSTAITSEPGVELFCKYELTRKPEDIPVTTTKKGYLINLPVTIDGKVIPQTDPQNLRDVSDGGSAWLKFRESNKFKHLDKLVNIAHFIEVKPIEDLSGTLI